MQLSSGCLYLLSSVSKLLHHLCYAQLGAPLKRTKSNKWSSWCLVPVGNTHTILSVGEIQNQLRCLLLYLSSCLCKLKGFRAKCQFIKSNLKEGCFVQQFCLLFWKDTCGYSFINNFTLSLLWYKSTSKKMKNFWIKYCSLATKVSQHMMHKKTPKKQS